MIPQGSNHATYAPSPAQIKKLAQSVAYIKMGHLSFESTWIEKIKSSNPAMKWYDLSENIKMIHGHHHHDHSHDHVCSAGTDPHTWTSPIEVTQIISNLKSYLLELFPQHKDIVEANYKTFTADLNVMNDRLRKLQQKESNLAFMIFHPAYTYLARAYNFEQITIEFEGKTPSPARLKETIELARSKKIKTIYIQQEFDQANAQVIAKEINAQTIQVNPLSANWKHEMEQFISHLENQ